MQNRTIVTTLGAFFIAAGTAAADPVSAGDIVQLRLTASNGTSLARFSNGGPFRMDLPGVTDDFLTFCLEADEYFTPGENLQIRTISHEARNGGVNTNSGDPISGTTAFLYTNFRLGNPLFSNGVVMQEAIWYLEGERATRGAAAGSLIALAETQMLAAGWGANFIGDVRVANIYRGANYATHAQDMLVLSSVPEPASLLVLGVGLLIGSRKLRRRAR